MAEEIVVETPAETPATEEAPVTLPSDAVEFVMPEQFEGKTAEQIAQAYQELANTPPKETPNEEPNPGNTPDTPTADLIEEYASRGEDLTDEDYKVLEEKGYSKRQVDLYKAGYRAEVAEKAVALLTDAGTTTDEATNAANWARENWTEQRVSDYNKALESSSHEVQVQMIQMLTEQFRSLPTATPAADPVHSTGRGAPAASKGYESMEQLVADQSDPKYDQRNFAYDPAYYKAVRDKVARSTF